MIVCCNCGWISLKNAGCCRCRYQIWLSVKVLYHVVKSLLELLPGMKFSSITFSQHYPTATVKHIDTYPNCSAIGSPLTHLAKITAKSSLFYPFQKHFISEKILYHLNSRWFISIQLVSQDDSKLIVKCIEIIDAYSAITERPINR